MAAPPGIESRQSGDAEAEMSNIALYITGADFDISELYTFRVLYANSSAYLGGVKFQSYSEPLVVGNLAAHQSSLTFQSIHSSPTGFQLMYLYPYESRPVWFSVPHGSPPLGVLTAGFSFSQDGALMNWGANHLHACRNAKLENLNAYQIYWFGSSSPAGFNCTGPIAIVAGDACSRY
ncbi:hypothetical protein B0A52_09850 [Exophiala mesophila]|uniref:Uncharacterized protein n=1 Tax=Exophiala mesophila TaxID=212818 RepID=A0A438MQQ3_EXOME|nr:hypothetical protein B0A52_09850 [Exophiala mesophila]